MAATFQASVYIPSMQSHLLDSPPCLFQSWRPPAQWREQQIQFTLHSMLFCHCRSISLLRILFCPSPENLCNPMTLRGQQPHDAGGLPPAGVTLRVAFRAREELAHLILTILSPSPPRHLAPQPTQSTPRFHFLCVVLHAREYDELSCKDESTAIRRISEILRREDPQAVRNYCVH